MGREHLMKILIAEDEGITRTMLQTTLAEWGYTVTSCTDGEDAWAAFQEADAPQLALLDWMMPGIDGPTLCRRLRKRQRKDPLYVILLTVKQESENVIQGLDAGADDYIVKPYDVGELRARINVGKRMLKLLERENTLQEANAELRISSLMDPLTGTYNRDHLNERLPHEISRSIRYNHPLSLVLCDIDDFKRVNDTYGHPAGDQALVELAGRIAGSVRESVDWVVRYGGDEFMIIFPGASCEGARIVSEKLRNAIGRTAIEVRGTEVPLTASFGVASSDADTPDREVTPEKMIRIADECLYRAKRKGKNSVEACRMQRTVDGERADGVP